MGKVKSRCAQCQQPVCRKHLITVRESCTYTQDITFLTHLDTCFVSKYSCVMYWRILFLKEVYLSFCLKKITFFEKNVFFLACNTHFTSIFTLIAHYFNTRLQKMYWNVSIFNVSKRVEVCHICFSKTGR